MKSWKKFVFVCAFICLSPYGWADEKSKIGVALPLSGELASFGGRAKNGILLAAERARESVSLVFEDTQGTSSEKSLSAVRRLIDIHGVKAIIGPYGVDPTLPVAEVALKKGVPVFAYSMCSSRLDKYLNVFCSYPDSESQLSDLENLLRFTKSEKVAVLMEQSEYSFDAWIYLRELEKRGRVTLVVKEEIATLSGDYRSLIARVMKSKPDAVLLSSLNPTEVFSFCKQLKESGFTGTRIAWIDADPTYLEKFGDVLDGIYLPGLIDPTFDPAYKKAYVSRYGSEPDLYASLGYDMINIVINSLERTGWDFSALSRNVVTLPYTTPAIPGFKYLPSRRVNLSLRTLVIKNRQFQPVPYEVGVEAGGKS